MERIILSRIQFSDMLSDFANEVKEKQAKKLDYDLWRPLSLWAKPGDGERNIIIERDVLRNYTIKPDTDGKTAPNPVYIDEKNLDFWRWVHKEFEFHCSFQPAWDLVGQACSNAVNSLNTATETLVHDLNKVNWDACTSNTLAVGLNCEAPTIEINSDNIRINGESLEESIKNIIENLNKSKANKEKENNNMKFGNFDFGPVDSSVRMSLYGMAIKNASGTYVAYDAKSKQVMDVDIFNFDGANKFIYKMPAAFKDIAVGDVVIHARKPMFVMEMRGDNRLNVLDIYDGEEKTVVLTKSPFNFDFITKVVSLVDFTGAANAANPFGNMLPLLMLSDNKGSDDLLPLLLMTQNNSAFASNPLMMYALMSKDGKMSDMLPWLLMCGSQVLPAGRDAKNAQ